MKNVIVPSFDYTSDEAHLSSDMNNKLFCTFSREDELEDVVRAIKSNYTIIFNKIFILYSEEQKEYICTYNVEVGNIAGFLDNTILVHRKKRTNTLYTINALNSLIMQLNNGILNTSYIVDWDQYKNCILLTKGVEFRKIDTTLSQIIEL